MISFSLSLPVAISQGASRSAGRTITIAVVKRPVTLACSVTYDFAIVVSGD